MHPETNKRFKIMAKRKFQVYQLNADFGEVFEESEDYRYIFAKYQRQETPKTLYGITEQGDVEVIFSRG